LTTPVFPITRSLHDNSLFSGKIQGAVFQEDINISEGAVPGQQMKSAFRPNFDAFANIITMAKQKFRPARLGGFSGTKAYIQYVEILKKRRNAAGRTFCVAMAKQKLRPARLGGFSGTKAYIQYVEILKKRRNAAGRTFCDAIKFWIDNPSRHAQ
jgi:hypothetical protein